jgi:glycosyltransferase involved in cell wall biosynthesis
MNSVKKKILLLHSSNDLYGASKIFLQIIQILSNQGYEIHVVLPSRGPMDDFFENKINLNYHSLGVLRKKYLNPLGLINRILTNLKAIRFLSSYIKKNKINLVYTNTSTILSGGIAAKKNKIPSLFHIHEIPFGNKFYELFIGKMINKYSNRIIAVSNSVKNQWVKYVNVEKITRIYNGIKIKMLKEKKIRKKSTFSSIGRIYPLKGHKYLLQIIQQLIKLDPTLNFNIYGDPLKEGKKYFNSLLKIIDKNNLLEHVKLKGFTNNNLLMYENTDFLIHTSIYPDSLPTVILESFTHSIPVISTNVTGSQEILDNGKLGLLIPLNKPIMSARLIYEYINDLELQNTHIKNSKLSLESKFNLKSFETKILKEISGLL